MVLNFPKNTKICPNYPRFDAPHRAPLGSSEFSKPVQTIAKGPRYHLKLVRGFYQDIGGSIFVPICENHRFSYIFYCFLQKKGPKQKGGPLGVKPKLPNLENLDIAFSHSIDSSHKRASGTYLFDIKVTRYRTCRSDRYISITMQIIWIRDL